MRRGWKTAPLGELCKVCAGGTPSRSIPEYWDGDTPWVKISDMLQGTITATDERITRLGLENSAAKLLPAGTLLLSIFATIGRTAVLGIEAATNQAIVGLTVRDRDQLSLDFLRRFLELKTAELEARARGVAQVNINGAILKSIEVPLPPLAEQRRIAEVLDRAEALRAQRRAAIAHLDTLTQSLFLDLFGDPATKGWAMTTIADVVNEADGGIRTGPFGSQLLHSEFTDHGIAVLGIDNAVANEFRWGERRFISEAKYRQLKRYTVRPGDVLITIMGTCGRCAVVPDDIPPAINTKHLCCITLNPAKCLPIFLHAYFLRHPIALKYLNQTAKGAIMSGLNMGLIKGMPVPLAPLPLQREFTRRVTAVEKLKATQRTALAELDALFASLQHRAFRGEL